MRSPYLLTILLPIAGALVGPARAADMPAIKSFNSNGVKIVYFVQGKGEPVILIHGWLSSAGINWALPGISGQLAKDYQVIALDVRGHGLSDKPTKEEPMARSSSKTWHACSIISRSRRRTLSAIRWVGSSPASSLRSIRTECCRERSAAWAG